MAGPATRDPFHKKLNHALTGARFEHVLAVADMAKAMAGRYAVSPRRAYLAGLLHDCARDLKPSAQKKLIQQYRGRFAPAATCADPCLWHNPAGVFLAQRRYQVKDPMILRAIGMHSTGHTGMNALDRLIYVADFCEPHRTHTAAQAVRRLLAKDLQAAARRVTQEKINYLAKNHLTLHPWTLALAKEQGIKVKS
ncbi:bis(5'-nucleosyl)-tetraphosphatase (symmetrical) YqeK [bacterium]|nr:bis(5'-nucleosyl)-tetraphosphatase (symmetrical) YqeK [bacterium]